MLTTGFADKTSRDAGIGSPFSHTIFNAVASDDNRVLTTQTLTVGTTREFVTADFAAQPDVPRAVSITTSAFTGTIRKVFVDVYGTDSFGNDQHELLVADAAEVINGAKAFRSVTFIKAWVIGTVAGTAAIIVGVHAGGLSTMTKIGETTDVWEVRVDGVIDAATIDAVNSTFTPVSAPDGAKEYHVHGQSTAGVVHFSGV